MYIKNIASLNDILHDYSTLRIELPLLKKTNFFLNYDIYFVVNKNWLYVKFLHFSHYSLLQHDEYRNILTTIVEA